MNSYVKCRVFVLPIVGCLLAAAGGCGDVGETTALRGETMGTTYSIKYLLGPLGNVTVSQSRIDDLLEEINASMSTYRETSVISMINTSRDTSQRHPIDEHFEKVFRKATSIYAHTGGAFNPAVGPLVRAWGFGPDPHSSPDSSGVDSLLALVDFNAFVLEAALEDEGQSTIRKTIPQAELDFSAIAKGYGVDALGTLLEQSGIVDYFVEIGGEVRARGLRADGTGWRFGIERPTEGERTIHAVVNLRDASLATSGNYRNFYVRDGQKYVHTINPGTGYPEINSLLSASVISDDCMTADAYATAFMVMGFETASAFADSALGLEAFFIASGQADAFVEEATSGMAEVIER